MEDHDPHQIWYVCNRPFNRAARVHGYLRKRKGTGTQQQGWSCGQVINPSTRTDMRRGCRRMIGNTDGTEDQKYRPHYGHIHYLDEPALASRRCWYTCTDKDSADPCSSPGWVQLQAAKTETGLDMKLLGSFLKKSYHDAKPVDITSVDVELAVPKGDNYGSIVHRVKFVISTASGRKTKRSIIVKTIAKWTEILGNTMSGASPVFRSEIMIYTTILPFMEDLMEEFGDKRTTLWPDLIGYRPYNMIAFEDLTETLYNGPPRRNCMNLKQSLLVLRGLGRFHAMSKVLISRGFISQQDKGQIILATDIEFMEKLWVAYFSVLGSGMETWDSSTITWKDISKKLLARSKGVNKIWAKLGENYDKRFEVLNHGDLWTCNLLIQNFEFDETPVSVKFVDFQGTHVNSFIWDVDYFLFSSTIASVRRANLELLHTAYQESLEKNLKFFDYTGYIPTLEDVKAESKRIEFVSMCCTMFQPLMMSETQMDLGKIPTHPPEDVIPKSVYSDGKAQERISEDMLYFYANGVMDFGE